MPSDKRSRQRAAREARLAAQAKADKRRKSIRNVVIVVIVAGVIVGGVALFSGNGTKSPSSAKAATSPQAKANDIAVKAGCPASTTATANTQTYSSPPPMTIDPSKTYSATVVTTAGTFTIALDAAAAPVTVNNFVFLADKGYYKCNTFLRVIPGFVDQTGDPTGTGRGSPGYKFANENIPKSYATGDVAMANSGANTNGAQFFIVAPGGASQLDADLSSGGYNLFGSVSSGMSVVNSINAQGSTSGTPPDVTQRILSVTIHES